ncbi:MAG: DUF4175 domain-containing protein [Rhodospirillaceae bacterium]
MSLDWQDLLQLRRLISRRLMLSRLSLAVERLTRALWAPVLVIASFVAVALFDVLAVLPTLLHSLILFLFLVGLLYLTLAGFRGFTWPTLLEARHQLETASGITHRPLTAWEDDLGYRAGASQNALWLAHRLRMQKLIRRLRPPWPTAVIAESDPYAIRSILILLCLAGFFAAWGDIGPRFVRTINPAIALGHGPLDLKVWLTPPPYTLRPTLLLDPSVPSTIIEPIEVPDGTEVLAVLTGTSQTTYLDVDGIATELISIDEESYRYRGILPAGEHLEIRQAGQTLGAWQILHLPDTPPTISLTGEPGIVSHYRSSLPYKAEDDYGVINVHGRIERPEDVRTYAQGWAKDFSLSVPPFTPKTVKYQSYHDLTSHPWAGESVTLTISATDAAGQEGTSKPIRFRLTERPFTHPVAATIINYRKKLINNPSTAPIASHALKRLIEAPESYGGDIIAHLAMVSAHNRLKLDEVLSALDNVLELMWYAALRIEDKIFAVAEQTLSDAENALNEAIENGASPEEVSRLIAQLQGALMQYYQAITEQMSDDSFFLSGSETDMPTLNSAKIAQTIEQLRQLTEMGANKAAKEMLANLRNMIDSLRNTPLAQMSHPNVEAAKAIIEELKYIAGQQSTILNSTFKQARKQLLYSRPNSQTRREIEQRRKSEYEQLRQPEQGNIEQDKDEAVMEQSELRQRLREIIGHIAEITNDVAEDLGKAEQAMRDAEDALGKGAWQAASNSQSEALANLQSGMQLATRKIMETLSKQGIAGLIPTPGQAGAPFGTVMPSLGRDQGKDVELPSAPDTRGLSQRSRALLKEIRKRSSQRMRTLEERQYLRRLLEQF